MNKLNSYTFESGAKIKIIRDQNGHSKIKYSNKKGSFSIRTNGQLPYIHAHRAHLEPFRVGIMQELREYLNEHGTKRQKAIFN